MINDIEHLIEQYVLGDLPSEEVKNFEQYLSENPDVQHKVDTEKDIVEAIKQKGRLQMKANLAKINPSAGNSMTYKIAIAAATMATASIIGFGIYTSSQKQQITEKTTSYTEVSSNQEIDQKLNLEEINTKVSTELTTTDKTLAQKTVTDSEIKETVSKPSAETKKSTSIKPKTKTDKVIAFVDPMSHDLGNEDEETLGTDEDIVIDPSKSLVTKSPVPMVLLKSSKTQGFTYDGKSIGISGTYKTAYQVIQKQGMLIFEYNNKFYEIIECKKLEKWEDHEITDKNILDQL